VSKNDLIAKRVFDILAAATGLILLSPFFILIGCLIKLDSKGSVFFVQKRAGLNGRIFSLFKFRTMKVCSGSEDGSFEPGNVSRVTLVGKFLRKKKLDELHQLINVLKGDMSFVGPRPEVEKYVRLFPEKWHRILSVRPGITDHASLKYRNEEAILSVRKDPEVYYVNTILPSKMALNIEYIDNQSFRGDIKIMIKTLKYILFK